MFKSHSIRNFALPVTLIAGLVIASSFRVNSHANAQQTEEQADNATLKVGVYDAQALFQQSPDGKELMEYYENLQQEIQKAQQAGDQMKIQQLQQEAEKKRTEVVENFHKSVDEILPDVADDAGIKVVAVQVIYTADEVQTENLTRALADAMDEE